MSRSWVFCLLPALWLLPRPVAAADESPEISLVLKSTDLVMEDLKYLLRVSHDPAEWKNVNNFMQSILGGIDTAEPIRWDVIVTEDEGIRYRPAFPVTDIKDFQDNLEGWGIKALLRSRKTGLYQLSKGYEGWMRHPPDKLYAVLGENTRDVPEKMPDARDGVKDLLSFPHEVQARLKNESLSGVESRHKAFEAVRREFMSRLVQAKDESPTDFELRKTTATHRMDQWERYFAEAELVRMSLKFNIPQETALLDAEIKPLAGTPLATTAAAYNKTANHFANLPQNPEAVLSLRVNLPLDEMRQKQLLETFALYQKNYKADIDTNAERTAAEKLKAKAAIDVIIGILNKGTKRGHLNMYLDVEGKDLQEHNFTGGIVAPDESDAAAMAQALVDVFRQATVERNVAEVAGVKIDKVTLPPGSQSDALLKDFLSGNGTLYLGISPKVLWIAGGDQSLEMLKAAIEKVAEPNQGQPTDPFISVIAKAGPWIERRHRRNAPTQYPEHRRLARQAFQDGKDTVTYKMVLDGEIFRGQMTLDPAILHFFGSAAAVYSRDNFK